MVTPFAYLLSFITSVFEIHIDKLNYLNYLRRPVAYPRANIGSWQQILLSITYVTIFVNAGLVVFTCECFTELHWLIFGQPDP